VGPSRIPTTALGVPLLCLWCAPGEPGNVPLLCLWCAPGVPVMSMWCTLGVPWCTFGVPLVCPVRRRRSSPSGSSRRRPRGTWRRGSPRRQVFWGGARGHPLYQTSRYPFQGTHSLPLPLVAQGVSPAKAQGSPSWCRTGSVPQPGVYPL